MEFTLVSTVFNEAKRINKTIADLTKQTIQPSEIVITDSGSTDGTYEMLINWKNASLVPIIILQKQCCNIAEGRNLAIKASKYDLIVSTDFGCRFHEDWLKTLTEPFNNPDVHVSGGAFTVIEKEQNTIAARAAYVMSNGYNIDINDPSFIPSSRSIAYKRRVFNQIGGYCEWLTLAADDLIFGKEILARGYRISFVNKPYVYWGRHSEVNGFIKEAGRYGLGDGEARVNKRNLISNILQLILRYLFFASLIYLLLALIFKRSLISVIVCLICFSPGLKSYYYYTKNWLRYKSSKYNLKVFLYGFYLLEATRIRYIIGYFNGIRNASEFQKLQALLLNQRLERAGNKVS